MDQSRLHEFESHCTQESPPHCQAACPFGMDVRAFMARMAEGRVAEARKLLERHVPLMGIMARICDHPCENACLRQDLGGSLAIHALEESCTRSMGVQSRTLPMPRKRFSIAVLGAGLAGLAAAYDLSRKGYPVTLYYEGEPRQTLLGQYPALAPGGPRGDDADPLAEDWAMLEKQKVVFVSAALDADLLARAVAECDGVLIDAGAAAALAPAEDTLESRTLHWKEKICCAGWCSTSPTGHHFALPSRQAGQGRRAAQTLERLVGGVSLTAAREKDSGPLYTSLEGVAALERIEPAGPLFTAEEAAVEAGRCLQCQCMLCVRQCAYMQKYKGYPRVFARQVHNNASIVKGLHTANALINGCSLCGQCEEICPENFSMAELCLAARQDMVERDFMPPSAHEFALEDMENASGPQCALSLEDTSVPEGQHADWLFFPGCQLAASRGAQVAALYAHLRHCLPWSEQGGGVSLLLSCCGIPAHWAGREKLFSEHTARLREAWEKLGSPRILTACSSCLAAFQQALPEARALSVWEMLDTLALPEGAGKGHFPPVFSINDPCTARQNTAWQLAVRNLAGKCGATLEEPRMTGKTTACCGYGGLVWCAQPETAEAMTAHRAAALPHPALASCIMCRDRLAAAGKESWHLLDLLFPQPEGLPQSGRGPGLSARRANRAALRSQLLQEYTGESAAPPVPDVVALAPGMLERLEERHILMADVQEAVVAAEASGQHFIDTETDHLLASWRPRQVTFWVEYGRVEGRLVLFDAWCHRMCIPGSGGWTAEDEGAAGGPEQASCCAEGGQAR